jgi:outer membrane protein assembly factor BamB
MMLNSTRSVRLILTSLLIVSWTSSTSFAQQDAAKLADTFSAELSNRSGLCVYIGKDEAAIPILLSANGTRVVNILTADAAAVSTLREQLTAQQLSGIVTAEQISLGHLPHSENLVNLVVVNHASSQLAGGLQLADVARILAPGGVGWIGQRRSAGRLDLAGIVAQLREAGIKDVTVSKELGNWIRFIKPRPAEMDIWTHNKYDATGNPVSRDTQIGVPRGVRWMAGPVWPTGHRKQAVPTVVASEKRLIYVFQDEVVIDGRQVRQDSLIARDAFNGLPLWKQPANGTVLITSGDRVYTTNAGRHLQALDADSGQPLENFRPDPLLVIYRLVQINDRLVAGTADGLAVLDTATGETVWSAKLSIKDQKQLVVGKVKSQLLVFCHDDLSRRGEGSFLVALDLKDGKEVFRQSTERWAKGGVDLVLVQDEILVIADSEGNHGVSAVDGGHLWQYSYERIGHGGSYQKVLAMNGLLWIHTANTDESGQYAWEGLNPQSGAVAKRVIQPKDFKIKHRCSSDVATTRYFMCGSMDFADLVTGDYEHFDAARNSCAQAGMLPANGLLYTFPHACGCYPMIRGFLGLTSESPVSNDRQLPAHVSGPSIDKPRSLIVTSDDWPTYRHDNRRSGATQLDGPRELAQLWLQAVIDIQDHEKSDASQEALTLSDEWLHKNGGRLTAPVVAGGSLFIAAPDHHQLLALDAASGATRWQFTTAARIDCPPTINRGLCLFGCRDGWVYCLDAADGTLVWQRRAAPIDRRILAYGQLESPWPVVGGVLVNDDRAFYSTGRHAGSDGGLTVEAVELESGSLAWSVQPVGFPGVPDILNSDGQVLQMASWQFSLENGENSASTSTLLRGGRLGLLNDAWYTRPVAVRKGLQGWTASNRPTGQLLSLASNATFGFTAPSVNGGNGELTGASTLFYKPLEDAETKEWSLELATAARPRALLVAGKHLYVAGLLDPEKQGDELLRVYDAESGQQLDQLILPAAVVHDGLAVARGRLYISLQNGQLLCLGTK